MSLQVQHPVAPCCTMRRQFTSRLTWRPEKNQVAGAQIEVRSHCLRAFHTWRFVASRIKDGDITFRCQVNPTPSGMWHNSNHVVFRACLPYGARQGVPIEFDLTFIPSIWLGVDNILSVWIIDPPNNFLPDEPPPAATCEAASTCTLSAAAGPVERLSIYSRPMPDRSGQVRTVIVPEDRFGNPGRLAQEVPCVLSWDGTRRECRLQAPEIMSLPAPTKGVGRARMAVPMHALSPCENIANGQRHGDDLVVTGNPVWAGGPDGLVAAFGEFHWHTEHSRDGQRPIREALRCARDFLNMDFAAPGDHNPQEARWDDTVQALEEFNRDDDFATFFGWENGTDRGHENYYFAEPDHPLVCGGAAGLVEGRPDEIAGQLREVHRRNDFIAIPHHTNSVSETRKIEDDSPYWHPYPWGAPETYIRLVEIFQIRGNQERNAYDDAWRGWHQHHGASVQDALALGHRVGFVGGTDNHCGWPGRAFVECEGLGLHPPKSVILTGLWTPRVERRAVLNALRQRHTWAVWDTRALVCFSVNGSPAGDEIRVRKGTELAAHVRLSAEDSLQTMELVSDGDVLWQRSFAEMDVDLTIPLGHAERTTHFYLRALQRNGGIIYASPVFVVVVEEVAPGAS